MTETLLERSARYIDGGVYEGPQANNPMDASFHEVVDDVGLVCAFSHVWARRTTDGLAVFDTSLAPFGQPAVDALRRWTDAPFSTVVYTHGHVDHVGGVGAFLADADARGGPRPRIVAHENAPARFERYQRTHGYNVVINHRQFGPGGLGFPDTFTEPDDVFEDTHTVTLGDATFELFHDRGETDDHAWTWDPATRTIFWPSGRARPHPTTSVPTPSGPRCIAAGASPRHR